MTKIHIAVQCFWMSPPFLTPRTKNHISDRIINSIFNWPFLWYSSPLFADLCFGENLLVAQAQCCLRLAFLREQATATVQKEDTVLCTMLLGTGGRQQIDWVSFRHRKRQILWSMQTTFPLVNYIMCPTNYCGFFQLQYVGFYGWGFRSSLCLLQFVLTAP